MGRSPRGSRGVRSPRLGLRRPVPLREPVLCHSHGPGDATSWTRAAAPRSSSSTGTRVGPFEFRHLIKALRSEVRCIAPDHNRLRPLVAEQSCRGPSSGSPRAQPGGAPRRPRTPGHHPVHVGLGRAHRPGFRPKTSGAGPPPRHLEHLVLAGRWRPPLPLVFPLFMSSALGQYLVRRRNFFVNRLMPMAAGDRRVLTAGSHGALPERAAGSRGAPGPAPRYPGHIVGARDWLDSIWKEHARFADKPVLILWGLRDRAFRRKELDRWASAMWDYERREFKQCGHFLAEEAPDEVVLALRAFLRRNQVARRHPGRRCGVSPIERRAPPPSSD